MPLYADQSKAIAWYITVDSKGIPYVAWCNSIVEVHKVLKEGKTIFGSKHPANLKCHKMRELIGFKLGDR